MRVNVLVNMISVYTILYSYELISAGVLLAMEGFWWTLLLATVHFRTLTHAFLYCVHMCMPLVEPQASQEHGMKFHLTI